MGRGGVRREGTPLAPSAAGQGATHPSRRGGGTPGAVASSFGVPLNVLAFIVSASMGVSSVRAPPWGKSRPPYPGLGVSGARSGPGAEAPPRAPGVESPPLPAARPLFGPHP